MVSSCFVVRAFVQNYGTSSWPDLFGYIDGGANFSTIESSMPPLQPVSNGTSSS